MSFMSWSDSLSVKVDAMDGQHKKLINLINQLHDAMKAGQGKEKIGSVLESLITYTKQHFSYEENYLKNNNYPGLAQHIKLHQALVKQVEDLNTKFTAGEPVSTTQVLDFLRGWLVNHIQKEDMKYGEYITSNNTESATA